MGIINNDIFESHYGGVEIETYICIGENNVSCHKNGTKYEYFFAFDVYISKAKKDSGKLPIEHLDIFKQYDVVQNMDIHALGYSLLKEKYPNYIDN